MTAAAKKMTVVYNNSDVSGGLPNKQGCCHTSEALYASAIFVCKDPGSSEKSVRFRKITEVSVFGARSFIIEFPWLQVNIILKGI